MFLHGYRVEDMSWNDIMKSLILPVNPDGEPDNGYAPKHILLDWDSESVSRPVSVSLPVYCCTGSAPRTDFRDNLSSAVGSTKRNCASTPTLLNDAPKPDPKAPQDPNKVIYKRCRKIRRFARRHLHKLFTPLELGDIKHPLEWINQHPTYSERRKQSLREVYQELVDNGAYSFPTDREELETMRRTGSFIKDECYPTMKASRWINASADHVKVLYGPYCDAIMHSMVKHPAMMKVIPVKERARAIFDRLYQEGSVYHAADYTSFESHFTPEKMEYIAHDFYAYMLQNIPTAGLSPLISLPLVNGEMDPGHFNSFLDSVIRGERLLQMRNYGVVKLLARRMSGEMDTSLGNTYSNYVMLQFMAYLKLNELGKPFEEVPCFVEGDDSLTRYPEGVNPTEEDYAQWGWVIKMERHENLCTASFCGLVFDEEDLVVVTDPIEVMAKFGWTGRKYVFSGDSCLKGLLRSKALSLACEYNNVPLLGAFAHRVMELTKTVNIRQSIFDSMSQYEREEYEVNVTGQQPWKNKPQVPMRTRHLVENLYGITIQDQLAQEEKFSKINMYEPFEFPYLTQAHKDNLVFQTEKPFMARDYDHEKRQQIRRILENMYAEKTSTKKFKQNFHVLSDTNNRDRIIHT